MGAAMAYHARKNGKTCLLLEKQKNGSANRYWSSSFSARQNRVQYTEKYLTQYVIESNKYWDQIEAESQMKFRHTEGALWFGNKYITTSEGNIFESNSVLEDLDVERLYLVQMIPEYPKFFKNFKFLESNKDVWKDFNALFQHDGGSINFDASYNYFLDYAATDKYTSTNQRVVVRDEAQITRYQQLPNDHRFHYIKDQQNESVVGRKIFIATGVDTPKFMKDVMDGGDHLIQESVIQEYLASYF